MKNKRKKVSIIRTLIGLYLFVVLYEERII